MASHTSRTGPTPLLVLTGFLGSGKTTLLNRLLAQPAMADTAVIVNELGPVGIDHLLVEALADDVLLLESGCICCSAGDDLDSTLSSLLTRRGSGDLPPFQRIVLETSGVAEPGRLLQRLLADPVSGPDVCIHGVLTVVDAVFGSVTLERHAECAQQVALANQLALSKLDLAEPTAVDALRSRLRALNPLAGLLEAARLDGARLFEDLGGAGVSFAVTSPPALPAAGRESATPASRGVHHADRYSAFCLRGEQPVSWADFEAWLEALLIARGESILRIKGLLNVAGRPRPQLVQGVQHALYPCTELPAWPHGRPCSEIVFVTRDFSSSAALRSLEQCLPRGPKFTRNCPMRDVPSELPGTLVVPESRYRLGRRLPEPTVEFLRQQAAKARAADAVRPWHYWELHNPWSRSGTIYDSWGFLELCQAPALLDPVAELIGPHIVLFDSGWIPDPSLAGRTGTDVADRETVSDAARFPVEPLGGATVLVAFAEGTHGGLSVDLGSAQLPLGSGVVCALEARVAYRVCGLDESDPPLVYVARYFPGTARYQRDPAAAVHRDLTERYPLLNYARLPLWLVRGEDRARNDFVTGLSVRAPYWSAAGR